MKSYNALSGMRYLRSEGPPLTEYNRSHSLSHSQVHSANQHKSTLPLMFDILRDIHTVLPAETHQEDVVLGCVIMIRLIISDKYTPGAGGTGLGIRQM